MPRKALFDEEEGTAAAAQQPDFSLRVNEEYAARFQHNKEREELHRLEAKGLALKPRRPPAKAAAPAPQAAPAGPGGGSSSSSSSDDEEDEETGGEAVDSAFLRALARIKQRDAALYDGATRLFEDSSSEGGEAAEGGEGAEEGQAKRKGRPVYLKDVLATQALEGEAGLEEEEKEGEGGPGGEGAARPRLAYDQEQEALRQSFLQVAEDPEGEAGAKEGTKFGGVLEKRRGARSVAAAAGAGQGEADRQALLDQVFGQGEGLSEADAFLRNFFATEAWKGEREAGSPPGGEDSPGGGAPDLEEDEEHLEAAERFEASYNFRFQEAGGTQLVTHARDVPGALRRPDTRRAEARTARAARKAERATAEEQELLRLKALKRKEIERQVAEAAKEAGAAAPGGALARLLEQEDFDPALYDAAMREAFDEGYYEADEEEPPAADPVSPPASDAEGEPDWLKPDTSEEEEEGGEEEEEEEEEEAAPQAASASTGSVPPGRGGGAGEGLPGLLGEYKALQQAAGAPRRARFRYTQVEPADQGLSIEEILRLPDKELNQVVGFKRLAAYRTDRARPNYGKVHELRAALREGAQEGAPRGRKKGPKRPRPGLEVEVAEQPPAAGGQPAGEPLSGRPSSRGKAAAAAAEAAEPAKPQKRSAKREYAAPAQQGPVPRAEQAGALAGGSAPSRKKKRRGEEGPRGESAPEAASREAPPAADPVEEAPPQKRKKRKAEEGLGGKGAPVGAGSELPPAAAQPAEPQPAKRRKKRREGQAAGEAAEGDAEAGQQEPPAPLTEAARRRLAKSREAEARRVRLREASFHKPTLPSATPGGPRKARQKGKGAGEGQGEGAAQAGAGGEPSGLSKAQRKNLARGRRRASKQGGAAAG